MIETYIENYAAIATGLFFFGAAFHLLMLALKFDADWSLAAFLYKGLSTGTAAIIPPFFFVFKDKAVLQNIQGVEYYLGISALVIFYFAIQGLIPKDFRERPDGRPAGKVKSGAE